MEKYRNQPRHRCTTSLNNYTSDIISIIPTRTFSKPPTHAIPLPEEHSNSYAVLPFINGFTKPLTRILRKCDIQVINTPFKTLQQEFPSPRLNINRTWFIKYPVSTLVGAMLVKPVGALKLARRKMSGMSKPVLMA